MHPERGTSSRKPFLPPPSFSPLLDNGGHLPRSPVDFETRILLFFSASRTTAWCPVRGVWVHVQIRWGVPGTPGLIFGRHCGGVWIMQSRGTGSRGVTCWLRNLRPSKGAVTPSPQPHPLSPDCRGRAWRRGAGRAGPGLGRIVESALTTQSCPPAPP